MKKTFALSLLIALAGCFAQPVEKTGLEGTVLPSFNLFLVDSSTYLNTGHLSEGSPVVLLYFGPHCPYSRAQVKEIVDEISRLKQIRFYFLTTASYPELKQFSEEYHLNKYKNIAVGLDYTSFFGNHFNAPGVPYMVVYGKDKRLKRAFLGKADAQQIIRAAIRS